MNVRGINSKVKRLTPNKIANLVMAEDAWHDSEYVRAEDYDALLSTMRETLEFVESLYDDEKSVGELAMALYEARNMARAALKRLENKVRKTPDDES